jgi:hypothetical protein
MEREQPSWQCDFELFHLHKCEMIQLCWLSHSGCTMVALQITQLISDRIKVRILMCWNTHLKARGICTHKGPSQGTADRSQTMKLSKVTSSEQQILLSLTFHFSPTSNESPLNSLLPTLYLNSCHSYISSWPVSSLIQFNLFSTLK